MEARTKIIAAVAVIMMCAAGLVGAGYAYTATTTNDGNSATTEYITLVQGGAGAYDFADAEKVYWDESDMKIRTGNLLIGKTACNANGTGTSAIDVNDLVTRYTLTDTTLTDAITDYTVVKIGQSYTLNPTHSKTTDVPDININFTFTEFAALPDGGELWIKTTCNGNNQYYKLTAVDTFTEMSYTTSWAPTVGPDGINVEKLDGDTGYYPVTVETFFGYPTANGGFLAKHDLGALPGKVPSLTIIPAATAFTFTIELAGQNSVFSLGAASNHVTAGGTLALIADRPVGWSDAITWESGTPAVATVSNTGVVSALTAGEVTITATFTHSAVEYTATFVVTVDAA